MAKGILMVFLIRHKDGIETTGFVQGLLLFH